jgi:hypothetical protein
MPNWQPKSIVILYSEAYHSDLSKLSLFKEKTMMIKDLEYLKVTTQDMTIQDVEGGCHWRGITKVHWTGHFSIRKHIHKTRILNYLGSSLGNPLDSSQTSSYTTSQTKNNGKSILIHRFARATGDSSSSLSIAIAS